MNELEYRTWFMFFEPQSLLCYAESRVLREAGAEDDHPEEIYVDQIPLGLKIYDSKDSMMFKNHEFKYTHIAVLARCSKCGALNEYRPTFWHSKDDSQFKEDSS